MAPRSRWGCGRSDLSHRLTSGQETPAQGGKAQTDQNSQGLGRRPSAPGVDICACWLLTPLLPQTQKQKAGVSLESWAHRRPPRLLRDAAEARAAALVLPLAPILRARLNNCIDMEDLSENVLLSLFKLLLRRRKAAPTAGCTFTAFLSIFRFKRAQTRRLKIPKQAESHAS